MYTMLWVLEEFVANPWRTLWTVRKLCMVTSLLRSGRVLYYDELCCVQGTVRTAQRAQGEPPMKIRPLQNRILVKRIEATQKTPGGLYIPPTASEKPSEATVIAVGPGRVTDNGKLCELRVKAGDRVIFGKYTGVEVKIDNVDHLILSEGDILGVCEE